MKQPVSIIGFLLLFILSFWLISSAKAQSIDTTSDGQVPGVNEQIDITVNPQDPTPNSPVTINLAAYGTDLSRADISWLVNGAVKKNGIGATEFDLTAGKAGTSETVDIIIQPQSGTKIQRQVVISPASVDITWESDSYTPPFYKGKALYPPEGNLLFVALPNLVENGVAISSKNLVYKWSINDTVLGSDSGYGKNTLTYSGTVLDQPFTVDVTATSLDNNVTGNGEIAMSSEDPETMFYEDNPLYGILFNRALVDQVTLSGEEVNVAAYPYFFSTSNPNSSLNYAWNINGSALSLPNNENTVTFRKTTGQSGQSSISLNLTNPINFLQSAANNLVINF